MERERERSKLVLVFGISVSFSIPSEGGGLNCKLILLNM